jgi:pSer/pThr/pTyr-binding forkhead associated (FHA) protein
MTDVPVLVCTAGPMQGQVFIVPEGGLGIGRANENEIVLNADGISRFHARLLFDGGSLWLQDAGSRNGVFVNGTRVTDHRALKVGDVIGLSECSFAVKWQSDVAEEDAADTRDEETVEVVQPGSRKPWYWPF